MAHTEIMEVTAIMLAATMVMLMTIQLRNNDYCCRFRRNNC
jgi:hypothetical protein